LMLSFPTSSSKNLTPKTSPKKSLQPAPDSSSRLSSSHLETSLLSKEETP
jgi:hypothetical protein